MLGNSFYSYKQYTTHLSHPKTASSKMQIVRQFFGPSPRCVLTLNNYITCSLSQLRSWFAKICPTGRECVGGPQYWHKLHNSTTRCGHRWQEEVVLDRIRLPTTASPSAAYVIDQKVVLADAKSRLRNAPHLTTTLGFNTHTQFSDSLFFRLQFSAQESLHALFDVSFPQVSSPNRCH